MSVLIRCPLMFSISILHALNLEFKGTFLRKFNNLLKLLLDENLGRGNVQKKKGVEILKVAKNKV